MLVLIYCAFLLNKSDELWPFRFHTMTLTLLLLEIFPNSQISLSWNSNENFETVTFFYSMVCVVTGNRPTDTGMSVLVECEWNVHTCFCNVSEQNDKQEGMRCCFSCWPKGIIQIWILIHFYTKRLYSGNEMFSYLISPSIFRVAVDADASCIIQPHGGNDLRLI